MWYGISKSSVWVGGCQGDVVLEDAANIFSFLRLILSVRQESFCQLYRYSRDDVDDM